MDGYCSSFSVTALLLLSVNRLNLELSVNEACYINRLARGTGTVVNKEEPMIRLPTPDTAVVSILRMRKW